LPYRIEIAPAAERQIRKLEVSVRRRIIEKIGTLGSKPRPPGVEKLTGTGVYRVRVGDYRIIYDIEDKVTTVLVLKVGDRKQVYKRLTGRYNRKDLAEGERRRTFAVGRSKGRRKCW
jgi:mRNA interferase RelE/StbE